VAWRRRASVPAGARLTMDRRRTSTELVEQLGDGFIAAGSPPRWPEMPRWAQVADIPDVPLPPVPVLLCRRAQGPITIDGRLDETDWRDAAWSPAFVELPSGGAAPMTTQVAFLWDDDGLYAGYRVEAHDIRAAATRHHEHVYMRDDDVELFVAGPSTYYELGVNPINTIYEIRWTWLEPLVERRDFAALEALLKVDDQFYYAARGGERMGRLADLGFELPGLRHAVRIEGAVNAPQVHDEGWSVEFALPWSGLAAVLPDVTLPPPLGDSLVVQTYRAYHPHDDPEADARMAATWPGASAYSGSCLSAMGNTNIHNPERWPRLRFVGPEGR